MIGIRELMSLPQVEAAEDYGFFGPDSVTWKVWSYPTSLTIGFQRSVVIEELDPALVAAVDKTHEIYKRPRTRYDRTLRYFAMVAFGDSASTVKAADVLVKIHSKAVGTDEVTGIRYDANDPASQLWIHLTAWHSILVAYEKYGPGKLSAEEEERYWAECALAAELQTCDPVRRTEHARRHPAVLRRHAAPATGFRHRQESDEPPAARGGDAAADAAGAAARRPGHHRISAAGHAGDHAEVDATRCRGSRSIPRSTRRWSRCCAWHLRRSA